MTSVPSACALQLFVRRLARYELDVYDEILAGFGGDVRQWLRSYEQMSRAMKCAIGRMPSGWGGCGGGRVWQRWLNALHDHIPEELLDWMRDEVIGTSRWQLTDPDFASRLPALVDTLFPVEDVRRLYVAAFVRRATEHDEGAGGYVYSDARIRAVYYHAATAVIRTRPVASDGSAA